MGLISNEGQAPDRTYIIAYDMHDRVVTHGNSKSLGEKLSARQYQSIHKCDNVSVQHQWSVFYTGGEEGARRSKVWLKKLLTALL
jgi:hypothetical protein